MISWLADSGAYLIDMARTNAWPIAIDLLLTGLLLYPLFAFLRSGWARKEEEIRASLTQQAKITYFSVFWLRDVLPANVEQEFANFYRDRYGKHRFLPAIAFVSLIAIVQNYFLAVELVRVVTAGAQEKNSIMFTTVAAAIAGAYTFVTWDFFGRAQRRSLSIVDILRGALRLAIAVPLGLVFGALAASGLGAFLAFGIGVFPLSTITTILRRLVNDQLKLQLGADTARDQVGSLAGVDRSIAEQIEDADVTTITQLAWYDPIQLIMRTSLSFDYAADIISQALAWVYLEEKLATLRMYGLRGAYEMSVLVDELNSADAADRERAQAVATAAATATGIPTEALQYAFAKIAKDGSTKFLYEASR